MQGRRQRAIPTTAVSDSAAWGSWTSLISSYTIPSEGADELSRYLAAKIAAPARKRVVLSTIEDPAGVSFLHVVLHRLSEERWESLRPLLDEEGIPVRVFSEGEVLVFDPESRLSPNVLRFSKRIGGRLSSIPCRSAFVGLDPERGGTWEEAAAAYRSIISAYEGTHEPGARGLPVADPAHMTQIIGWPHRTSGR